MITEEKQPTSYSQAKGGIVCPECGWSSLPVTHTRRGADGETFRVRECRKCKTRILCRENFIAEVKRRI